MRDATPEETAVLQARRSIRPGTPACNAALPDGTSRFARGLHRPDGHRSKGGFRWSFFGVKALTRDGRALMQHSGPAPDRSRFRAKQACPGDRRRVSPLATQFVF
jgi:hypothetical protein